MAILKKLKRDTSGGVDIQPDSYIGLLVSVIHVGTQKNEYKGVSSLVDSVALRFELQDVLTDKGTPVVVTKIMRNSLKSKASLTAVLEALGANIDEGADFDDLIGQPVLVEMGFNQAKTKVGVKGFTALPKMMKKAVKPTMTTPVVHLDVEGLSETQIKELPEWLGKVILNRVGVGSEQQETHSGGVEL